jgi:hypothetical protein
MPPTIPPPLSVFDTESRPNLFATIAVDHNVIENPPPHASWVDNQTIPIIRTCVKCSWRGRPLTYDIGSVPIASAAKEPSIKTSLPTKPTSSSPKAKRMSKKTQIN